MPARRAFATCLLILCPGLAAATDSQGNGLSAQERRAGFRVLFNGKDLTGWREVQGKPGSFHVADGIIHGQRDRERGTAYWLSTQDKYGDFELRLEVMLQPGGNSGVFIRVPSYRGRTSKAGMEIQLRDDGGHKGQPGKGDTGAIYSAVAPKAYVAKPAGQWNDVHITCLGDHISVAVNGQQITEASMAKHESLRDRPREGYIGLSAHTRVVKFRNVRLRRLSNDVLPAK